MRRNIRKYWEGKCGKTYLFREISMKSLFQRRLEKVLNTIMSIKEVYETLKEMDPRKKPAEQLLEFGTRKTLNNRKHV